MADNNSLSNIESEMSLLGSMIISGGTNIHVIGDVLEIIPNGEAFFLKKHSAIFEILSDLYNTHQALDAVLIMDAVRGKGIEKEIGGSEYIVQLAESVPIAENATYYARIIANLHYTKQIKAIVEDVSHKIANLPSGEPHEIIEDTVNRLYELNVESERRRIKSIGEIAKEWLETVFARDPDNPMECPTGFKLYDYISGGLKKGELTIVAGRPGMGKSALLVNIAHNLVRRDCPVLFFSLEMSAQSIINRMIATNVGIDTRKIERNELDEHDRGMLQRESEHLAKLPVHIDDNSGLTMGGIEKKIREQIQKNGIKVVFIDYAQLIAPVNRKASLYQQMTEVSNGLKRLAMKFKIPVVVAAQLNRKNEGSDSKRPTMSGLRDSGAFEQDADVIALIYRDDYYHAKEKHTDKAELIVAKNRHGETGSIDLHWQPHIQLFSNITRPDDGQIPY